LSKEPIKTVLLVEDNTGDARLIREMFNEQGARDTELVHVQCLSEAEKYLAKHEVDIILLDLGLPDSQGLNAVRRTRAAAPRAPLVVLTGLDDESLAAQALQEGAQDYLIKGQIETRPLLRAMRYAVERVRAEDTLRSSNDRFQLIAESIDEVFWIANPHFTEVSYVSPGYVRVWGRTQSSLYENPRSFLAPVHPKDLERTLLRFEVMKSGKPFDHEYRITRPDGAIRWIWNRGYPVNNEKGEVTRYVGVAQDITERKRAEERLLEYEKALESLDEMIMVIDREYRYVIANLAYLNYRHVTSEQLAERAVPDFLDKDIFDTVVKNRMDECFRGKVVKYEMRNKFLDLGERDLSVAYFPIEGPAGIDRIVCVLRDITERKRAEAERTRLMTAVEQAAESVLITDAKGEIQYVNPAFSTLTGYGREEVLGKNPRILKSGKQDAAVYTSMWGTILAGQVWRGETINRRKDGTFFTEKMSITPVRNEHGEITHIIALGEDITARKLLEDQFRQAQKMEAVGRLAAGVAHDFNNLLTIIMGYSDLMLDQFVSGDPRRAYTTEIKDAGERAVGLTRQLLAFSRQQVLAPQILDLNALMANLIKLLKRLIGEDIELAFKAGPLPSMIRADPGQIEQILMNLVVNSRDAMPRGGKLTIETSIVQMDQEFGTAHYSAPAGSYALLALSDTGCGMDKEVQAHIFEPFFTTKEQGKGTGLGLATVYGIVQQSGGYIWVYSEPEVGTTFKIYLPAVTGTYQAAQVSAVPAGGLETVLLVEDDAGLRELARMVLEARGGYKVLESTGGKAARLFAGEYQGPIHLLLTDVVMPGMSGRELSEGLATARPEMKILYMSGYTDDTVVRHGVLEAGVAFLQKPFSADSLLRKVRDVLDAPPQL
jgi:two-component system, cell cycle sensor histidine kinase and response regulator CckA